MRPATGSSDEAAAGEQDEPRRDCRHDRDSPPTGMRATLLKAVAAAPSRPRASVIPTATASTRRRPRLPTPGSGLPHDARVDRALRREEPDELDRDREAAPRRRQMAGRNASIAARPRKGRPRLAADEREARLGGAPAAGEHAGDERCAERDQHTEAGEQIDHRPQARDGRRPRSARRRMSSLVTWQLRLGVGAAESSPRAAECAASWRFTFLKRAVDLPSPAPGVIDRRRRADTRSRSRGFPPETACARR